MHEVAWGFDGCTAPEDMNQDSLACLFALAIAACGTGQTGSQGQGNGDGGALFDASLRGPKEPGRAADASPSTTDAQSRPGATLPRPQRGSRPAPGLARAGHEDIRLDRLRPGRGVRHDAGHAQAAALRQGRGTRLALVATSMQEIEKQHVALALALQAGLDETCR